jgi:hypothetical protein
VARHSAAIDAQEDEAAGDHQEDHRRDPPGHTVDVGHIGPAGHIGPVGDIGDIGDIGHIGRMRHAGDAGHAGHGRCVIRCCRHVDPTRGRPRLLAASCRKMSCAGDAPTS